MSFIYGSIAFRILNVSLLCVLFNLETHLPVRSRNCAMAVVHSSPTAGLISSWMEQHQQQHTNQPYDTTTPVCRSVAHRDPRTAAPCTDPCVTSAGVLRDAWCLKLAAQALGIVALIGWMRLSRTDRGANNLARKTTFHGLGSSDLFHFVTNSGGASSFTRLGILLVWETSLSRDRASPVLCLKHW